MADEVAIVRAASGDVDAIHRIEAASFPSPWRREFFAAELSAEGRFNLVARRGPEVIAYLFAMWIFDEMHVNKIAVIDSERRKGIAAALMEHCFAFARDHEIRTVSLEVRESNDDAQEFYRRLGFATTYVRRRYYPDAESAVVMSREL